ncbi:MULTISPECIES: shufflon system plasmid conjugative transfer pilus tip adhesin PilV [Enterobacteriaceae]|uniref:shufflon system plasmid conjugative transfer pilus tip adhesin PilV n=1 Tax=Enterobacteriaceae TaxID=543 RepID=UPI0019CF7472|nr:MULTISPECIES: shufflon system plasmid conjugative transfer pilus tip adhesin PilV [Enterobacter cloacae complex]MCO7415308.1 shufflon system plasmid conjugative transfer pilus tip adhesin PilV [Enterobacter asburiae]UBM21056.1 shufflon system plasmid conjugative transfer pilus tip adhesin PilV [Enterobacter cloacae complex sp. ECL352]HBK4842580.1 shufflon system plasmid conjugative transfer pilus tip adhesin PilV [Enterobacter asburiae]HDV9719481.1 shufflon system plasmid conjugative transfe
MKMKIKKGFSLLELTLVLGVGTMVAFMKFQDMKNEQESIMASAVGQQMKQIGEAVNGYINIRYDKLSTLSNAAGTGTDPGPRTCSGSVCKITYQTLINEGLLPSTYTGTNANKSSYKIILKRDGTSPNYVINGLITTSTAWIEGGKTRYDLLGKAMQTAGIDSGMTQSSSSVSGYSGAWSNNATDFNNITQAGLLGYRVGYDSAMYSVYLRRDGTLPMTGDLDMGGKNINNAQNITASGATTSGTLKSMGDTNVGGNLTVTGNSTMTGSLQVNNNINATGNVNAGNWVWAKNGYGDSIGFGGDAFPGGLGPDYELLLGANRPLTIHSPNSNRGQDVILDIDGNTRIQTKLATNSLNPNDIPSGWEGGLRTQDVYGSGTIGAGIGGNVNAYINSAGNIYASGNITGSTLDSTGRATVGEYLQVNGLATSGQPCLNNGLQGRDAEGSALSCVNGLWVKFKFNEKIYSVVFESSTTGSGDVYKTLNLGKHLLCVFSGDQSTDMATKHSVVYRSGDTWILEMRVTGWKAGVVTWARASCFD